MTWIRKSLTVLSVAALSATAFAPAYAAPVSDDDINSAYQQQEATSHTLAGLELEVTQLATKSNELAAKAADAQKAALNAQAAMEVSINSAIVAQEKANKADADLQVVRRQLGSVSQVMYQQSAGEITQSYYLFGADSVEEANKRSKAYGTVATQVDSKVQRFKALEEVARVMHNEADAAAQAQAKAAAAVQSAADAAQKAVDEQQAQIAAANKRREEIAAELATQRGTTVELERQRLADLETTRKAKADSAAALVLAQANLANQQRVVGDVDSALAKAKADLAAATAAYNVALEDANRLAGVAANASGPTKNVKDRAAAEASQYAQQLAAQVQSYTAQVADLENQKRIADERAEAQRIATERAEAERRAQEAANQVAREQAQREAAERAQAEAAAQARAEEAAREAANQNIPAAPAPAPAPSPNPVAPAPANPNGNAIISYARQFIGSPYVWGGVSPNGWDCVGFVWFVYQHFGITTPRATGQSVWTYWGDYRQVSPAEARPGDVLWWPGHVGLYTGNGMHVAAWNPSMGTQERAVWGSPIYLRIEG
ncbi:NlpC/P60 family protein [Trueperella sp. LYQ143]|uniref:C40 family peptidase n=1 Tax=Trueperella sp. LYQ143 TaxID=3391059 RepID=UPI003983BC08